LKRSRGYNGKPLQIAGCAAGGPNAALIDYFKKWKTIQKEQGTYMSAADVAANIGAGMFCASRNRGITYMLTVNDL
jgi:hypothetical protein